MRRDFRVCTRLLVAFVLTAFAIACSEGEKRLSPYGWTSAGDEFDSLTLRAEQLYILHDSVPEIEATVHRMRMLADADSENCLLAQRATFWQGRLAITCGDLDRGIALMGKALEMTDSARYPYDYNRIKWNMDLDYHEPTIERYQSLVRDLDFFISSGDRVISGGLSMELGCFLDDLGLTDEGMPYLHLADSLFLLADMPGQVAANRINHANALRINGDTVGAIRCFERILADTVSAPSPYIRDIVVGNLYSLNNDTALLREAYDIVTDQDRHTDVREHNEARFLYASLLEQEAVTQGNRDAACYFDSVAVSLFPEVQDPNFINDYYQARYMFFANEGRTDSALHYLVLESALNDSILSSVNREDVRNASLAGRIKTLKVQAELQRRNTVLVFVIVSLALLILLVGVTVYYWRRLQNQRLGEARSRLEVERSNRKIMAMELLIKEKNNLFEAMEHELSQMSDTGEISRLAAGKIESSLKAHNGMRVHREAFSDTFDKVNPHFRERLMARYPSLTDAELRLATYLTLGLENKHLAAVLGIRPESVKQARWRLRTKMSLDKDTTLEDALRRFTE